MHRLKLQVVVKLHTVNDTAKTADCLGFQGMWTDIPVFKLTLLFELKYGAVVFRNPKGASSALKEASNDWTHTTHKKCQK